MQTATVAFPEAVALDFNIKVESPHDNHELVEPESAEEKF